MKKILQQMLMISICTVAHAAPANPTSSSSRGMAYSTVDTHLGEALYPDEEAITVKIADLVETSIRRQYQSGMTLRDAHPKAHGCVKAEFKINDELPQKLAQGIFVQGKTYPAWIRFSNASSDATQADSKKDARGMAIKVLGISGPKLLDNEHSTQDFILINHPVFFVNSPVRYMSFIKDMNSDSFVKKLHIPFSLGAKGTWIALNSRSKIANPLHARYWSMVPYQLGLGPDRQAVKYSVQPCSSYKKEAVPVSPTHDFLRESLQNSLQKNDACMEFLIQPRTSNTMSVEDSMTEWKENKAPFYKVATIRIPQQFFDTPDQNRFCENLSFSPWHSIPEHKPLGAVNRMRKFIYERISKVRHEMNDTPRIEPNIKD